MASRELYSSVSTPKRKFSLAHDILAANLNSAVAPIEGIVGSNFYDPRVGSKDAAKMMIATDKAGRIANAGFFARMGKGKGAGASTIMQGASEMGKGFNNTASLEQQQQVDKFAKAGIDTKSTEYFIDPANYNNPSPAGLTNSTGTFAQSQFGNQYSNLGTTPTGPQYMAMGGMLTKYQGNTHEDGGIKLAGDEVEDNETSFNMNQQSDFIFSDRVIVPGSKQSFATKSKRIDSKYKLRPNDPYGKKSQELELRNLAMQQEEVKQLLNPVDDSNQMAYGGMRYDGGGLKSIYPDYLTQPAETGNSMNDLYGGQIPGKVISTDENGLDINYLPANLKEYTLPEKSTVPVGAFGLYNDGITRMQPKGITLPETSPTERTTPYSQLFKSNATEEEGMYKSNFMPALAGYAMQAATNIPSMFVKPNIANFSRVKFKPTSLAEARNEARRSRNLGLATARGVGANSNDIGQVMNYLSGTTAALNSQYGNLVNQSLGTENNANSELNMKEQLANSEIERYEENINTAEKDSVRNLKMQALMNMGTAASMAGKEYIASQQADNMVNALDTGDYVYKTVDGKLTRLRKKYNADGSWDGKSTYAFGGKIRRKV